jgi:hypothetical protein
MHESKEKEVKAKESGWGCMGGGYGFFDGSADDLADVPRLIRNGK